MWTSTSVPPRIPFFPRGGDVGNWRRVWLILGWGILHHMGGVEGMWQSYLVIMHGDARKPEETALWIQTERWKLCDLFWKEMYKKFLLCKVDLIIYWYISNTLVTVEVQSGCSRVILFLFNYSLLPQVLLRGIHNSCFRLIEDKQV